MKKILVIRFSSIGDIVLTTPIIRCLHEQLGAEVHFLTKPAYASMLSANPHIHKIHSLHPKISQTIKELRKERFDFIVDLHKNLRTFNIKIRIWRPSASFPKLNFKKWLMVRYKVNKLPAVHIVDRYFKAVEKLNVANDHQGLDYFIHEQDISSAHLPVNFFKDGYLAIAVGSKHATKQIPPEKILEICKRTVKNVVLLGDESDRLLAIPIENEIGPRIFNACGVFNLNQTASIIQRADVVVAGDTGIMHIASALRKKIINVWGNTIPEFGMYPYFPETEKSLSVMFEVKDLPCRPCSKLGYPSCPKKHFKCMLSQDYDAIIKSLS